MASVTTILTAISSFALTVTLGMMMIPWLKRLKFGQTIREDGPTWHKQKEGTPTMGGLMFVLSITLALSIGFASIGFSKTLSIPIEEMLMLLAGIIMAVMFGMIGFLDDYIKIVKKQNLGLNAKQKIVLQIIVTALYLTAVYFIKGQSTHIFIPFINYIDFGFFYFPILGILIVGIINSTNLTDGIDGLCTMITFVVASFFIIATGKLELFGVNLLAVALAAGCIGFLAFNLYPASVFMGDTGSFFLGGCVMALAFCINMEFILFFAGFVYCFESLSVILQVISVKTTGKRIFKMSPIHHHFEMIGWKENKIVAVFSGVTLIGCIIAYFAVLDMISKT